MPIYAVALHRYEAAVRPGTRVRQGPRGLSASKRRDKESPEIGNCEFRERCKGLTFSMQRRRGTGVREKEREREMADIKCGCR